MKQYEIVREIQNLCGNNQKRDITIHEVETDDPVAWVQEQLLVEGAQISTEEHADGSLTVFASAGGLTQKFDISEL